MRTKILNNTGLFIFIFLLGIIAVSSCTKDYNQDKQPPVTDVASCEGCHTNYAHLQEVYTPDTGEPAGGCGGEAPHYEPYDRVYMGGDGFEAYQQSGHYSLGCVYCHGGTDDTGDKNTAHSGDFIKHPSMEYKDKCGDCHAAIVDNFETNLHHGTGQKRKVTIRSGLSGPQDFDQLPQHQIEGYNANCATCHGTCGNCHIVRPPVGGGGLSNGHSFNKTPDMLTVCVTCHVSRGGHAYLGVATGTQPDVHLTKAKFKCINCHDGAELHGNGQPVEQRYAYTELPKCVNCHTGLENANTYHTLHYDDFNCQVCHSQVYNNCGSCHIHGDGARIPAYMDYKIAQNPIPNIKQGYKFVLVRRTLAAPDNWDKYGVQYSNFDAFPTYNYTTPHNILRWTDRTDVTKEKSCYSNCHIRNDGGTLVNKELYLFKENLLDWEHSATDVITCDDELPSSWF